MYALTVQGRPIILANGVISPSCIRDQGDSYTERRIKTKNWDKTTHTFYREATLFKSNEKDGEQSQAYSNVAEYIGRHKTYLESEYL